jgi:hypothetical protein
MTAFAGGSVYGEGGMVLRNTTFSDGSVTGYEAVGGAIIVGSTLSATDVRISNCSANTGKRLSCIAGEG